MLTRIRDVRKAKGLTLADVAARCRPPTTAQTIGRLETGTRTVSVDWLNRIADALEADSSALVTMDNRPDVPVAAVLGPLGADAPMQAISITAPLPGPAMVGLIVEASQGDYRSGDQLWAQRLEPSEFPRAINRDVLAPRPGGRFAFGRLVAMDGGRIQILPAAPGARQIVLGDVPWLAMVSQLVRGL
ncbi:helix-turn-helix transcriptional regulator [Sandarakinorhabdus sp.]|uniref:helix-turn-helix domain-containing protein n=1 Tax=Sandarakinorhabdus sp. TaxID=1916663 RepID=UPI00286E383E|nr:helix-turn-helix transcriptional regulator [Sandarakinorhabdus sp.]